MAELWMSTGAIWRDMLLAETLVLTVLLVLLYGRQPGMKNNDDR